MTVRAQAGLAVVLAIGLHVAAFSWRPDPAGAVAAGAGGADLASLQAADATLADLVADWDRPPIAEVAALADLAPPPMGDAPPVLAPAAEAAPVRMPSPEAMPLPQMAEAPPTADVSLPPPALPDPVAPEPELPAPALPEPEAKPEPQAQPAPTQRPKARPATAPKPEPTPKAKTQAKPKPAAKSPSAAQPAARAAGSGGGAQAGAGGTAQAATLSKSRQNDLKASWGASIRNRVERRKSYPSAAGGASGTVTVRLSVSRAGQLGGVSVAKSSGNAALDQAALRAVQAAGRFPAAPAGLKDASYTFTLPMKFAR
ncbi:MAG: TonB family protein [Paracoccaceae bacterium]